MKKSNPIVTVPESVKHGVQHGLGITKQRFHTRTLAESPDSEYYQGMKGQAKGTMNEDLRLIAEPKFRLAGRPKSAAFNNFGPLKRMHQKKS